MPLKYSLPCLLILLLCSCKTRDNLFANYREGLFRHETISLPPFREEIHPGDQLSIRNLKNPWLVAGEVPVSYTNVNSLPVILTVDPDGTVILPVLGRMELAGMEKASVIDYLNREYRQALLNDPLIEISIINSRVTLLGEFSKQGTYPLNRKPVHLLEYIGTAGGFTALASRRKVLLIRGLPGNQEITNIDLADTAALSNPDLLLRNGDIIYAAPKPMKRFQENAGIFGSFMQSLLVVANILLLAYSISH